MIDILRYHGLFLLLAAPCVGSFLGVVAVRLPQGRSSLRGRSACPHCGTRLGVLDLVPILGWCFARGRCRHCGAGVSWSYPAIELAALIVAAWSLAVLPGWLAWASCVLGWSLIALAVIDARHLLLPDALTLPLVPAGLAVAWWVDPAKLPDHALGAAAGFLALAAVGLAYRRLRGREGLGLGDAKLFAAAGAWLSWEGLPSVLLLAAAGALAWHLVAARLTGRRLTGRELPFGPYLAAALWLVWLYGPVVAG
jgi:leader peptidase (prepilin peptidase)/N-methyltransferase